MDEAYFGVVKGVSELSSGDMDKMFGDKIDVDQAAVLNKYIGAMYFRLTPCTMDGGSCAPPNKDERKYN